MTSDEIKKLQAEFGKPGDFIGDGKYLENVAACLLEISYQLAVANEARTKPQMCQCGHTRELHLNASGRFACYGYGGPLGCGCREWRTA